MTIELPPLDIPAAGSGEVVPQPEPYWTAAPITGWVHGFAIEIVDGSGNTAPASILHHIKIMSPDRRELFSPIMLRVLGAGSETESGGVPSSIGFPVQSGDSLLVTAMLHNTNPAPLRGVRIRVRLNVTPVTAGVSPGEVYPFFLHVTSPAGHSEFDLPPGRSEKSWEASPAVAGEVIGFGGHAHRYATELRLEDVSTGDLLWRSRIRKDAAGEILDIPRTIYKTRTGPTIYPDRVYRLTVVYDNPTGETLVDQGMGTVGGMLRAAAPWPAADRTDPLYLLDRNRELANEAPRMLHVHEGH